MKNKMKLVLRPVETPFRVGDTVFVNLPYSSLATNESTDLANDQGYFEAVIVRIFLEGLKPLTIIAEPKEIHELIVTNIIYDLKPMGIYKGAVRVALNIDVESKALLLFSTEKELKDYYNLGATNKG